MVKPPSPPPAPPPSSSSSISMKKKTELAAPFAQVYVPSSSISSSMKQKTELAAPFAQVYVRNKKRKTTTTTSTHVPPLHHVPAPAGDNKGGADDCFYYHVTNNLSSLPTPTNDMVYNSGSMRFELEPVTPYGKRIKNSSHVSEVVNEFLNEQNNQENNWQQHQHQQKVVKHTGNNVSPESMISNPRSLQKREREKHLPKVVGEGKHCRETSGSAATKRTLNFDFEDQARDENVKKGFRRPRACHTKKVTDNIYLRKGAPSSAKSRGQLKSKRNNATEAQRKKVQVPFGEPYTKVPIKKRPQVPKAKISKFLMGEDCNSSIDGPTEAEIEKWWEEQWRLYRERVKLFIARMHTIQGNRRFTEWKGSVVDSVIGAFLTQNVNDHLSSSAFMTLAARFPLQSTSNHKPHYKTTEAKGSCSGSNSIEKDLMPRCKSNSFNIAFSETTTTDTLEVKKVQVKKAKVKKVKGKQVKLKPGKGSETWESLRKDVYAAKGERSGNTEASQLDHEALRCAAISEIAKAIMGRGMHNNLAKRIKDFLNKMVKNHGTIDLEWLKDIQPDQAKEYLMSIYGLGLKSVECIRLLTLHQPAFPVDTNVGRITVRLGWVQLQSRPEDDQLHLLESYPMLNSIQEFLWPRLCKLDQEILYELHYQMITFGKVFCTKKNPNCNACPMRAECKHFASALASARPTLPGPEEKDRVPLILRVVADQHPAVETNLVYETGAITYECEPIVEEPTTPENKSMEIFEFDIEDAFCSACPMRSECKSFASALASARPTLPGPEERGRLPLTLPVVSYQNPAEDTNLVYITNECISEEPATPENRSMEIYESDIEDASYEDPEELLPGDDMSMALVPITPDATSTLMPKLKNVTGLRTEHFVYELPDEHPLLEGLDRRVPNDPCPYLLAIWAPGEAAESIQPSEKCCGSQKSRNLCNVGTCFSCTSIWKETVPGTFLVPVKTAMGGSFPLNGTYFQVNEVFADHDSSMSPIPVPRDLIWNLPRRIVFFGTSVNSIYKGLSADQIKCSFWGGYICVRGFERKTKVPRPLNSIWHASNKLKEYKQVKTHY